jgi:hypothetical protein
MLNWGTLIIASVRRAKREVYVVYQQRCVIFSVAVGSCDYFMDLLANITDLPPTFRISGVDLYSIRRTRGCIAELHYCCFRATPNSRISVESAGVEGR